jgi:hypothetical protein
VLSNAVTALLQLVGDGPTNDQASDDHSDHRAVEPLAFASRQVGQRAINFFPPARSAGCVSAGMTA